MTLSKQQIIGGEISLLRPPGNIGPQIEPSYLGVIHMEDRYFILEVRVSPPYRAAYYAMPEELMNHCFELRTNRPKILHYADTKASTEVLNGETKLLCAIMLGIGGVAETFSYRAARQNGQLSRDHVHILP